MSRSPLRRIAVALALLLTAQACRDAADPVAPGAEAPSLAVVDASTGGNPGVLFLPPLRPQGPRAGTFDPTVPLTVEIRLRGGDASTWTVADGSVTVAGNHYALDWRVPDDAVPGDVFEIRARALTLELGRLDVEIAGSGRDMVRIRQAGENAAVRDVGRNVPVRLWINQDAVGASEEAAEQACAEGEGVLDCDVELLTNEGGGDVRVVAEDPETGEPVLAGRLTVDPGDVVDAEGQPVESYVLTLLHLPPTTAPAPSIPSAQQFPFVLRATLTDGAGNPLAFATGASLVLCQPADLETNQGAPYYLPAPQAREQSILKVDGGAAVALPTVYGAPECEGNEEPEPVGVRGALSLEGLARLARRTVRRAAALVLAEPLRAGHGGLTTIKSIRDLSDFAGALLTDPAVSGATVPDGTAGEPTTITIQARVTGTVDQTRGGDAVVITVSGANTASLSVGSGIVDNGDGTYSATYTPDEAGTDLVAVTIAAPLTGTPTAVTGSPFTSTVTGAVPVWADVATGHSHACGLTSTGQAYCWGDNDQGQLGTGGGASGTPVAVATTETFVDILAADDRTCAVTAGGELFCWGRNDVGQLGTGAWSTSEPLPQRSAPNSLYRQVSLGDYHACGVTVAGTVECWGGQGGIGSGRGLALGYTPSDTCPHDQSALLTTCSLLPVEVDVGFTVETVSAGMYHTCLVTATQATWCWGMGAWGQLGNGDPADVGGVPGRADPQLLATPLSTVDAGNVFSCGIAAGATATCWGGYFEPLNAGQTGSASPGTQGPRTPQSVVGAPAMETVHASRENDIRSLFACGLSLVGEVWCWGSNERLQLGTTAAFDVCNVISPAPCTEAPQEVGGLPAADEVRLGMAFACALSDTGRLHCWGANDAGQLGNGAGADSATPVEVAVPGATPPIPVAGAGLRAPPSAARSREMRIP